MLKLIVSRLKFRTKRGNNYHSSIHRRDSKTKNRNFICTITRQITQEHSYFNLIGVYI